MKKVIISVVNTGLSYDVVCDGSKLCSFPSKRAAVRRAVELSNEFGVEFNG